MNDETSKAIRETAEPSASKADHVLSICRELRALDVPLRVLAPIIAHVDPLRCAECGRTLVVDSDWDDESIKETERDDLCWGFGANCEADYDGDV